VGGELVETQPAFMETEMLETPCPNAINPVAAVVANIWQRGVIDALWKPAHGRENKPGFAAVTWYTLLTAF
jgi:hypothetical protein